MGKYLVELDLDGYEDEAEQEAAEVEFIYEQLNFSASSVKVSKLVEDSATADTIDPLVIEVPLPREEGEDNG